MFCPRQAVWWNVLKTALHYSSIPLPLHNLAPTLPTMELTAKRLVQVYHASSSYCALKPLLPKTLLCNWWSSPSKEKLGIFNN